MKRIQYFRLVTAVVLLAGFSILPCVESATITWGITTAGTWSTDSNWLGGVAPGASDAAVIPSTAAGLITISTASFSVLSITHNGTGGITCNSATSTIAGTLTLNANSVFTTGASTFVQAGTVRLQGTIGSQLIVGSNSRVVVDNLYISGTSGTVTASSTTPTTSYLNVTTYFEWGGSNNKLTTYTATNDGVVNLAPGSTSLINVGGLASYLQLTLNNYGTMTYSCSRAGNVYGLGTPNNQNQNAGVRNYGTMTATGPASVALMLASPTTVTPANFWNYGLLNVNVATDFQVNYFVRNYGTINVQSGTLRIINGGASFASSMIQHTPGGFIQIETAGTTFSQNAGSTVANGTGWIFAGGLFSSLGTFLPITFSLAGGDVTFARTNAIYEFPTVTQTAGGTVTFGPSCKAYVGQYTLGGTSVNSYLYVVDATQFVADSLKVAGSNNAITINGLTQSPTTFVNVTNYFEWGGSNNKLTTYTATNDGVVNLAPGSTSLINVGGLASYLQLTLNNYGTMTYSCSRAGNVYGLGTPNNQNQNAGVRNYGTMTATGPASVALMLASPTTVTPANFWNYGLLNVNVATDFQVNYFVRNYGTINVQSGTLRIINGGASFASSMIQHTPGSFVQFEGGGTFTQAALATVGNGTGILFKDATVRLGGFFLPSSFQVTSSTASVYFERNGAKYEFASISTTAGGSIFFGVSGSASGVSLSVGDYIMSTVASTLTLYPGVDATVCNMYLGAGR
eukprot:TRINITY_DN1459_c0_g1_i3.p1 TRINITY_DN1459_c0_g1~~TRINITY_DN1459_c0_g1_i3.p1  ORF type:complete len:741 (-),score=187.95 TRINITY_DN1459_c0_g1_i3:121-2343(-)